MLAEVNLDRGRYGYEKLAAASSEKYVKVLKQRLQFEPYSIFYHFFNSLYFYLQTKKTVECV